MLEQFSVVLEEEKQLKTRTRHYSSSKELTRGKKRLSILERELYTFKEQKEVSK
jgi:hypothetical protein